jgi:hypothetical protein
MGQPPARDAIGGVGGGRVHGDVMLQVASNPFDRVIVALSFHVGGPALG